MDREKYIEKMNLEIVREHPGCIKFTTQNEAICIEAVKQDGDLLKYVKQQSPAICLAAVMQNGDALKYVWDQTPEICKAAVAQNSDAKWYVRNESMLDDCPAQAVGM